MKDFILSLGEWFISGGRGRRCLFGSKDGQAGMMGYKVILGLEQAVNVYTNSMVSLSEPLKAGPGEGFTVPEPPLVIYWPAL
jgi:hypothetical protein